MLSGIKRLFQSVETVTGLMTRGTLYDYHQYNPELAHGHSMICEDHPPRTLSQQLIDDLADLRENTTIVGRDPAAEARSRLMRPFFEPGASLPWPPVYPPAPLKYDFYADRYSEESSSPPSSFTSEPLDLGNWSDNVSVAGSLDLSCSPTHPQHYNDLSPRFDHGSPVFIPHIIGEDDPFNPFSYDLFFEEDKDARSIDTPNGKIFAPVPTLSTTAALANFESIALAERVGDVVEKKSVQNKDDSMCSDEKTSDLMSSSRVAEKRPGFGGVSDPAVESRG